MHYRYFRVWHALALTCLIGCGDIKSRQKALPLYPVTGVVFLAGKPVENANVTFRPVVGIGTASFGVTDPEGKFTLRTYVAGDGAPVSDYFVTIEKKVLDGPKQTPEEMRAEMEKNAGKPAPAPVYKSLVPEQYGDPKKSGLKAEVKASGPNDFKFDLKE